MEQRITRREQTLCSNRYDSLQYKEQHELFAYVMKHDIPMKFLDSLVGKLKLERQAYYHTTPMEQFELSYLDQNQCNKVLVCCQEYVEERKKRAC